MFQAVKKLNQQKFENPSVHDSQGKMVSDKQKTYQIIESHFKNVFHKEGLTEVERFTGPPRPLHNAITAEEIKTVTQSMSINKSPGKDQIPVELIKYAPKSLIEKYAVALNNIFIEHNDTDTGTGILAPVPKPNKVKGPVKNLRPVTILQTDRKILSKITVKRIENVLNDYLSVSQSAYGKYRSTTDIVWAHRWISAKVQNQEMTVYIIGIDMSSAFDTIFRHKLIEIAETIMNEDEVRMLRVLLTATTLEIKVKGAETNAFVSNIGSPQGDAISGPLFNLYFEYYLRNFREFITNLPIDVTQINDKWIEQR